jgi:hypothetical protein
MSDVSELTDSRASDAIVQRPEDDGLHELLAALETEMHGGECRRAVAARFLTGQDSCGRCLCY